MPFDSTCMMAPFLGCLRNPDRARAWEVPRGLQDNVKAGVYCELGRQKVMLEWCTSVNVYLQPH